MARVAFLGLGVMGFPMAGHLAAAASMLDAVSASERANWALGDTVTLRGMSEPTQLAILA